MNKYLRVFGFYLVILLIIVTAVTFFYPQRSETTVLKYSELLLKLENDEVAEIKVGETKVTGVLKEGNKNFESIVPRYTIDERVTEYSIKNPDMKVVMDPPKDSWWISLIPSVFIVIMMIVFLVMMNQQSGGGGRVMSFGKSKAQLHMDNKKKVTFDQVAGADEEKEELAEVVDFLKSPEQYNRMGARIARGIPLVGPPGTGKTLLARAVAGEASVPFYIISGSDFVEMFVGVGASRVRDLFETAKKTAPCIIFIDEIDAVGRHRGAGLGGGHDEREQTLNQLLVEMDGFGVNEGVIVIAATNRPDILDPALLRPGRFDRQITVGIPDVKGRYEILQVHRKDKPLDSTVDLNIIAKGTPGFTGADLENLMNEAALLAARKKQKIITMEELQEAIKRVIAGPEKRSKVIEESDRIITAFHESGHAIVMEYMKEGQDVHEISIIPRGMAAGYTIALPSDDTTHMSRGRLMAKITGLLGGRAAEKVALEDICTGASNDIERVTTIARKMVTEWGMSEHLGPMTFGHTNGDEVFLGRDLGRSRNYSEEVAAVIDQEIRFIVEGAFDKAVDILTEKRHILDNVANKLLEVNTLTGDEFRDIYYSEENKNASDDQKEEVPSLAENLSADGAEGLEEDDSMEKEDA
ncbi:MAG: ATP-dependent metallopeptidase FtsH/Yme1/Tma family protein [Eubacteriaceae bacterium]|nr:ATP-dependent metallopeptidase FtsH/Yme1/Tma family protein [Eubacteriaceae bacterium]